MIKKLLTLSLFALTTNAYAGCLDDISTTSKVTTTIKGFFSKASTISTTSFIIIDKATCQASSGSTLLGTGTQANYYLSFDSSDVLLWETMMMAYKRDEKIDLTILPDVNGYNKIAYVMTPSGARYQ